MLRSGTGSFLLGPAVAHRFRELASTWGGDRRTYGHLRAAADATGHTYLLGAFVGGRISVVGVVLGWRELPDYPQPGPIDDPAASALGQVLLATVDPTRREHLLRPAPAGPGGGDARRPEHEVAHGIGAGGAYTSSRDGAVVEVAVPVIADGALPGRLALARMQVCGASESPAIAAATSDELLHLANDLRQAGSPIEGDGPASIA